MPKIEKEPQGSGANNDMTDAKVGGAQVLSSSKEEASAPQRRTKNTEITCTNTEEPTNVIKHERFRRRGKTPDVPDAEAQPTAKGNPAPLALNDGAAAGSAATTGSITPK